jgi:hypothetical protein
MSIRGGRRDCIPRSLQARLRGHCEQTAWVDLSSWPLAALAQGQELESASGEARGRRGLGALIRQHTERSKKKR